MATIQLRRKLDGTKSFRSLIRVKGQPSASATLPGKREAKIWAAQKETLSELTKGMTGVRMDYTGNKLMVPYKPKNKQE